MKKQRSTKLVSLLIIICMLFSVVNQDAYANDAGNLDSYYNIDNVLSGISDSSVTTEASDKIVSFALSGPDDTTELITYYVGGVTGTVTGTIGESSDYPFATLQDAMLVINQKAGNYHIIIQGDTIENSPIDIGDGTNTFQVTISAVSGSAISKGAVTGSAIATSGASITSTAIGDSLISVQNYATLILKGDNDTAEASLNLIGSSSASHSLLTILPNGFLKLLPGVMLKNNDTTSSTSNYYDISTLCGGIYNMGHIIMEGGSISGNTGAYYGGVYNVGSFIMSGGSITTNSGSLCGGVLNEGTFEMSGGENSYNLSGAAGNVYNKYNCEFYFTGGSVIYDPSCYAGVYNSGAFTMSGSAVITGTNDSKDILLLDASTINLVSNLTVDSHISLLLDIYSPDLEILTGEAEIIRSNYHKFSLDSYHSDYSITDTGILEYHGMIATYYVDGNVGKDTNPGTEDLPFATIDKAKLEIYFKGDVGTIYICSDLYITKSVVFQGTINMKNLGGKHTIFRSGSFDDYMFISYGVLILGDIDKDPSDQTYNLAIDGNNLINRGSLISNSGILKLYPGVVIQNSATTDAGGVSNDGRFIMYGGSISHNANEGISNRESGTFIMKGGNITANTSFVGGGIGNRGKFIMEGGIIKDNTASYAGNGVQCMSGIFIIKDDAVISSNNDVNLISEDNVVTIGGRLLGDAPVITISTSFWHRELNPGNPIVVSGEGYNFTAEDMAKITLSDARFFLNSSGMINAELKDSYVIIDPKSNLSYTGSEIKPTVIVYIDKALTEGTDFTVSYENNTNVGAATVTVEGLGNYCGKVTKTFEIKKAVVNQIATEAPVNKTIKASENKSEAELLASIMLSEVEVVFPGGTAKLPITWKHTEGSYHTKSGIYTYTGTLTGNNNIDVGTSTLTINITVEAVELNNPDFDDIAISRGKKTEAQALDLGNNILPVSGIVALEGKEIHYTIKWDDQTINTTLEEESTIFTGTISYSDAPSWATLPSDLTVKRKVSIAFDKSYTIKATVEGNGSITPSGKALVNRNENKEFTIAPAYGYLIYDVLVDGKSVGAVNQYTFSNVIKEHTIEVRIREKPPVNILVPTAAPTPTTIPTPTGIASPIPGADDVREIKAKVSVKVAQNEQGNELNTSIGISEEEVINIINDINTSEQTVITIPVSSEELTRRLSESSVSKVNIDVTVPDNLLINENIAGYDILLASDILETAKNTGKDVTVAVKNEKGDEKYSWMFAGDDLANSRTEVSDINMSLEVEKAEDNPELNKLLNTQNSNDNSNSLVIKFGHHGELPSQAKVRIYVGDLGFEEAQTLYLYYFNSETGKLDTLPYSSNYKVDKDGYVAINIIHCSYYVLLPKKADSSKITSLLNQISVTVEESTLYLGKAPYNTTAINLNLPNTLKLVQKLQDDTDKSAVGEVIVAYRSSDSKVAEVDNQGNITAISSGKAVITAKVTLYSGKTKTYKIITTVKKPYITLTKSIDTMGEGKSFKFEAESYGLNKDDIIWSTTKRSIVVINKKTGKATAKTKGTDYVTASIDGISVKKRVVVK
ncbi:MAG TPA: hypothetical protein VJZ06_03240 [Mobilitalea sp.]|nr:hypothetical protein [Mobilitalea sp.]